MTLLACLVWDISFEVELFLSQTISADAPILSKEPGKRSRAC